MKIITGCIGLLVLLTACHSGTQTKTTATVLDARTSGPVDPLHARMNSLLYCYYRLKDEMVNYDTTGGDSAASEMDSVSAQLQLRQMKDTSKYDQVHSTLASLQGELEGYLGETTMEGKREEFQMISDITYDLVKTVGLRYQTVYREFCPMAFNYKGAYWLSSHAKIENPYLGKKMLDCGEVRETMKF